MYFEYDIFSDPSQYNDSQIGWDDEEEFDEDDYIPDWDIE